MRHFSFVTLATVGYGDIVPHSATARTVALLEAMLGQFYLVALIGRLVGLHIVHSNSERRGD
jgi:voltage-gated potassium channel